MMKPRPQSVNKFYFLDYFYVLLKSVKNYESQDRIFDSFRILKQKYQLGESKYKKLTSDSENLSKRQMVRYRYTFEQVTDESLQYNLIKKDNNDQLTLTPQGQQILKEYEEAGPYRFKKTLIRLMENKFYAMYYLVKFCYEANPQKGGLLVFPVYSPLKLDFQKADLKKAADIIRYSNVLTLKLQKDIKEHLEIELDLRPYNEQLIQRLKTVGLLSSNETDPFESQKYNVIIKRFRDFWLSVFLKEIYKYEYSFSSFDIWIYRAKQVGIFHVSEFYPNVNGRIVYPTSIITDSVRSNDFEKLFEYEDGTMLYIHRPAWTNEQTREKFVEALTNSYIDARKTNRSYFVNLADLRERVCYKLKIAANLFDEFLERAYKLNLSGQLKVNISLEADKLPEETSAMYLKREPVMVDGKYRNIIAIDITRGR